MQEHFAKVWEKLAIDYTERHMVEEYNSFKHGFRANIGSGPKLSFESPDQVSGTSDGHQPFILSSDCGSWFNVAKKMSDVQGSHLDRHFTLEHCHVNLEPEEVLSSLFMISISINNIVAFLRLKHRFPVEDVRYMLPQSEETFENFLKPTKKIGLKYIAMNPNIPKEVVTLTKQQIIERLTRLKQKTNERAT